MLSDPLPPTGELSRYEASNLLLLIDKRYCSGKPTILTVNLASEQDGLELIGAQAWDRLKHEAEIVWCKWPSYRNLRTVQLRSTLPGTELTKSVSAAIGLS